MAFRTARSDKKSSWGKGPTGGSSDIQKLYTLQVDLAAGRPMTCVIEIGGHHTLEQLHEVIDAAFERIEKRLWDFHTGLRGHYDSQNRRYGPPDLEDDLADDASETTIDDLKLKQGNSFTYTFDLDNPMDHAVEVVSIAKVGRALAEPRILKNASESTPQERRDRIEEQSPAKLAAAEFLSLKRAPSKKVDSNPERDAQAAACSYILVALLQRLEKAQPGLAKDLVSGIEADRDAVAPDAPDREFIEQIFNEALKTVRQAAAGIP